MPSEYIIRKLKLISLVNIYTETEMIWVIMPTAWSQVLNIQLYGIIVQFQNAVKFYEDNVIALANTPPDSF